MENMDMPLQSAEFDDMRHFETWLYTVGFAGDNIQDAWEKLQVWGLATPQELGLRPWGRLPQCQN